MGLNPKALGLTVGILAGGVWLVFMGVSLLTGFLDQTVQGVGALHPAFSYSWTGLLWMVALHLVAGFIWGYIIGWTYNRFNK